MPVTVRAATHIHCEVGLLSILLESAGLQSCLYQIIGLAFTGGDFHLPRAVVAPEASAFVSSG